MARYREYKNGIFGHRYNGLFVIRGESKGEFKIVDKDNKDVLTGLLDFDECIWQIDKLTASEDDLAIIRSLYDKDLFQLSSLYMDLHQKNLSGSLDERSKALYKWTEKVRNRKDEDREF